MKPCACPAPWLLRGRALRPQRGHPSPCATSKLSDSSLRCSAHHPPPWAGLGLRLGLGRRTTLRRVSDSHRRPGPSPGSRGAHAPPSPTRGRPTLSSPSPVGKGWGRSSPRPPRGGEGRRQLGPPCPLLQPPPPGPLASRRRLLTCLRPEPPPHAPLRLCPPRQLGAAEILGVFSQLVVIAAIRILHPTCGQPDCPRI